MEKFPLWICLNFLFHMTVIISNLGDNFPKEKEVLLQSVVNRRQAKPNDIHQNTW